MIAKHAQHGETRTERGAWSMIKLLKSVPPRAPAPAPAPAPTTSSHIK